jgi:hypothetical protein
VRQCGQRGGLRHGTGRHGGTPSKSALLT